MLNLRFLDVVLDAAADGANTILGQIKGEAQHRAPVRKLFKGGYKIKFRGPGGGVGVRNQYLNTTYGRAYSIAVHFAQTVSGGNRKYPIVSSTNRRRGRQNSSIPTTARIREFENKRLMGTFDDISFREVRKVDGQYQFATTQVRAKVGGKFRILDIRDQFAKGAARDLARGRGLHQVPGKGGHTEYGGTLRDSIEVEEVTRRGDVLEGYVKASAIETDGRKSAFNYAYAQEFGTAHNAPQPYLRPAARLFAMRLAPGLSNPIRTALQRMPAGQVKVTTDDLKIVADFGKTTFAQQAGVLRSAMDRAVVSG